MKWFTSIVTLIMIVGCTPISEELPSLGVVDEGNRQIIDYIDKRLNEEYYWLDEVEEKSASFNRTLHWKKYLDNSLRLLSTNVDDGYINTKEERVFYSYIRDINDTRTTVSGFGIGLYYTIIAVGEDRLGFVINNVYADSPAAKADIRRGDIIRSINGSEIDRNNYASLFTTIENNSASELHLVLERQTATNANEASFVATLQRGTYSTTPIAYHDVITIKNSDKRIGYLVYTGFQTEYDDELLAALGKLAAEGVDSFILDLRTNGGGNVDSAVKLCSALLSTEHIGATLCELRRNPRSLATYGNSICALEEVGVNLNMKELTVICSDYSASASELLITGLRGLDITVTLIGSTTEGKNCGMDVTRRTINDIYLEYAPITFMCYNAKGFGEWGEGLVPDIDLTTKNAMGISDEHYPLPRAAWGDMSYDIGLATAVASVTGKKVSTASIATTRQGTTIAPAIKMQRAIEGIRYYPEE